MILTTFKLCLAKNIHEKIISFYFFFLLSILLTIGLSPLKLSEILDIILLLFLLMLLAVLFLNFNSGTKK